jgi:hypothetical protein
MTTDLRKAFDQKCLLSQSMRELVRNLQEGTRSAIESTKIEIENSRRRLSMQRLNLDSEPTGNRIRESF